MPCTPFSRILPVGLLLAGFSIESQGQTSAQSVSVAVNAINQIAFTGAPSLAISTATAGSAPTSAFDASASWAVTTNQSGAKIVASISTLMPSGLTLSASLVAPAGASSASFQALGITAVELVTGIGKLAQSALGVTYRMDATPAANLVSSASRVVTYTITGGV